MAPLKRILGLIIPIALAGSFGCKTDPVRRQEYADQQNGMRIPLADWRRVEHRYVDLNAQGAFRPGYQSRGNIVHDGRRYDLQVDLVDVNRDGKPDLVRATIESMLVASADVTAIGAQIHQRVLVQDRDFDGNVDYMWMDYAHADGREGRDGIYDSTGGDAAGLHISLSYVIDKPWELFQ